MKFGMLHFRTGETDGVSLEMDKWKYILEKLGHEVIYIAGSGKENDSSLRIVDGLHYKSATNNRIVDIVYKGINQGETEQNIKDLIYDYANDIKDSLVKLIKAEKLDYLVPNNVLSLGWNLSAGIGVAQAIEQTGVSVIAHHHDFHWERELYSHPKYEFVRDILNKYFPYKLNNIKHVVINSIAKRELKQRYNIDAEIVPNVFDYDETTWGEDSYNKDMKEVVGIKDNQVVFLQATRVVERKGIELAIDVIAKINECKSKLTGKTLYNGKHINEDTEFVMVLAGLNESEQYYNNLIQKAKNQKVKVIDINDRVDHVRKTKDGKKIYSLWDAHVISDFVTYPSLLEGFGNQFLEAIFAKKPLLVYEYPVFDEYLKTFGFEYVSLSNSHEQAENGLVCVADEIIKKCADETIEILTDNCFYKQQVDKNYEICKEHFSYKTLQIILSNLI